MTTVGLDIKDIKGPEDYKNYYHADGLGDIWVDGKGHPIELTVPCRANKFNLSAQKHCGMGDKLDI